MFYKELGRYLESTRIFAQLLFKKNHEIFKFNYSVIINVFL